MNGGTIQRAFSGYDGEKSPFQTKLTIGVPGDKYEQEADSMAEKVMSMDTLTATNSPTIQSDSEASFDSIQEKPLVQSIHPLIQRQIDSNKNSTQNSPIIYTNPFIQRFIQRAGGDIPSQENTSLESRLASQKGSGSPLDEQTRSFMEPRFGNDFSSVRVHTDSSSVQMNQELGAQAFTHGQDVYFGAGKYNPKVDDGKQLLAHELTHVVQQTGAVQPKSTPHKAFKQNKIQTKALFTSSPEAQSIIESKKQSSQESTKQNRQEPIKEEQPQPQESLPVADVKPGKEQAAKNQDSAKEPATEKSSAGAAVAPQVKIQGEADSTKAPATGKTSSSAAKSTSGTKAAASPQEDPEFPAAVNNAKVETSAKIQPELEKILPSVQRDLYAFAPAIVIGGGFVVVFTAGAFVVYWQRTKQDREEVLRVIVDWSSDTVDSVTDRIVAKLKNIHESASFLRDSIKGVVSNIFQAKKNSGDERNPASDKMLTPGEIEKLKEGDVDIHDLKGGDHASRRDLYKDAQGNIYVKPKGGRGPGEETGLNINDF